jgi:tetratricopeptide (TPR) repeat protein
VARGLTANPIAWFHAERLNLIAITQQACTDGRYQYAADLALCQAEEQERLNLYQDTESIWRTILDSTEQVADVKAIAIARFRLAGALEERGYSVKALSLLHECVPIFERDGDDRDLAFALYWQSITEWALNRNRVARDHAARGVALGRRMGDPYAELSNLRSLGVVLGVLGVLGEYADSVAACECALDIANEVGDSASVSDALHSLAFCCALAGEHQRAVGGCPGLRRT